MMSANAAVLESDDLAGVAVDALMGEARLWVVRSQQDHWSGGAVGESAFVGRFRPRRQHCRLAEEAAQ